MRRFLLFIILVLLPLCILGQKHNLTNQYVFNPFAINPAIAGAGDALSTTLLYRNQWTGVEGAPETMTFSAHSPLRIQKMGLGISIINDNIGVTHETSLIGNYSYKIHLGAGQLSMGLGVGVILINTAWTELKAVDPDDELIQSNSPNYMMPDFSIGLYYSTKKYHLGFSLPYFLTHNFNTTRDKYIVKNDPAQYNYMFSGDYLFEVHPEVKIIPSLLLNYNQTKKMDLIATTRAVYREKFSIGTAFDTEQDLLRGMFQLQLNKQLRLGYALDFNTGKLSRYKNGSHEIMLRYDFRYTIKVQSPRNL